MKQFFAGILVTALLVIIGLASLNGNIQISTRKTIIGGEPQPGGGVVYGAEIIEVTATPGGVVFTIIDDGSEPVIRDLVPTAAATAVPLPTYTPYPTYTPVKLFNDYGLPPMGPYSLEEVGLCESIIDQGNIDLMPSPQRGLCEAYVAAIRNQ